MNERNTKLENDLNRKSIENEEQKARSEEIALLANIDKKIGDIWTEFFDKNVDDDYILTEENNIKDIQSIVKFCVEKGYMAEKQAERFNNKITFENLEWFSFRLTEILNNKKQVDLISKEYKDDPIFKEALLKNDSTDGNRHVFDLITEVELANRMDEYIKKIEKTGLFDSNTSQKIMESKNGDDKSERFRKYLNLETNLKTLNDKEATKLWQDFNEFKDKQKEDIHEELLKKLGKF